MAAVKQFVEDMEDRLIPAIRRLGPEHRTKDVLSTLVVAAVMAYPAKYRDQLMELLSARIEDAGMLIDDTPEWAMHNNFLASRIPVLLNIPGMSVAKYLTGFAVPEKQPHLIWKRFPIDMVQIGPNRFSLCWNADKMKERKYGNVAARNTDMHLLTEEIHEFRLLYTIANLPAVFLLEAPRAGHSEIAVLNVLNHAVLAEARDAAHGGGAAGGAGRGGSRRRRVTRRRRSA